MTYLDSLVSLSGPIFAVVGAFLVSVGGIGAITFFIFKALGERWLTSKFEQQLAAFKHAQQKELEELKFQISKLLDRSVKLHQREFEVLPETWAKLSDAHGAASAFVSPSQKYPDLDRLAPRELDEFLNSSALSNSERDDIKQSTKKNNLYVDKIFWYRLSDVDGKYREFYFYFRRNGIFIEPSIKQQFDRLQQIIWDAVREHEFNHSHKIIPKLSKSVPLLTDGSADLIAKLEKDVQQRLWA